MVRQVPDGDDMPSKIQDGKNKSRFSAASDDDHYDNEDDDDEDDCDDIDAVKNDEYSIDDASMDTKFDKFIKSDE